jgi:hypothetical protein
MKLSISCPIDHDYVETAIIEYKLINGVETRNIDNDSIEKFESQTSNEFPKLIEYLSRFEFQ